MKRKYILPLIAAALIAIAATNDVYLKDTIHPFTSLGTIDATAAGADSALGVTERSYSLNSALDNVVAYTKGTHGRFVVFRFKLATNNHDVDIDMWVKVNQDDNLLRVATLDVINGQQDVYGNATLHFADTINISNEAWIGDIWTVVPGTDLQGWLIMDMAGCESVLFHGYGTFDGDCIVEAMEFSG